MGNISGSLEQSVPATRKLPFNLQTVDAAGSSLYVHKQAMALGFLTLVSGRNLVLPGLGD